MVTPADGLCTFSEVHSYLFPPLLPRVPHLSRSRMAGATGMMWVKQWATELAEVSDHVKEKIPDGEEWHVLRNFLRDVSSLLRRGEVRAGMKAFYKVLPYIQRTVSSVEKCSNISYSYEITQTISQHFLVDDTARAKLEEFMRDIKRKTVLLKAKIESFAKKMDNTLEEMIEKGKEVGSIQMCRLAFQMNRINAMIRACESRLFQARSMLDALDTHVATKSLLATIFSFIFLAVGFVFSAAGQVPAGAACITAATASRSSAKNLNEYRRQLGEIEGEHRRLQAELDEWRMRFQAEQRNFLLLLGYQRFLVLVAIFAFMFLFMGKAANFCVFALCFLYFVIRAEDDNSLRNYSAILLGVLAMVMEYQQYHGMVAYNTVSCVMLIAAFLGFMN